MKKPHAGAPHEHDALQDPFEDVGQGQVRDVDVVRADAGEVPVAQDVHPADVADQVAVTEHGALGQAGRAAGEADRVQVLRLRRDEVLLVLQAQPDQVVELPQLHLVRLGQALHLLRLLAHVHQQLQFELALGLHGQQQLGLFRRVHHHGAQLAVRDDVLDGLPAQRVVQGHYGHRVAVAALLRHFPLPPVLREDAHKVLLLAPLADQARAEALDLPQHLLVGHPLVRGLVVGSPAQAVAVLGKLVPGHESVMQSLDAGVEAGQGLAFLHHRVPVHSVELPIVGNGLRVQVFRVVNVVVLV